MLWGLTLLALPVIAHLLHQHARRRVVFPTLVLLMQTHAGQSRWMKLRRLLLLLLRAVAMVALILAFARPVWFSSAAAMNTARDGKTVLIVLDISASMSQKRGDQVLLEEMRTRAGRVLDRLTPGRDRANIIFAGSRAKSVFAEPTHNIEALRPQLLSERLQWGRADVAGALAMAGEQLKNEQSTRELVILSDFQRTDWHQIDSWLGYLPSESNINISFSAVSDAPGNVTLGKTSHYPAAALVNRSLSLQVTVHNNSPEARDIEVTAAGLTQNQLLTKHVQLQPFASAPVIFSVDHVPQGFHAVSFSAQDDALEADNSAHLALHVVRRLPVLLLDDDAGSLTGSAGYFLERALEPRNNEADVFDVQIQRAAEVTPEVLEQVPVVFVSNSSVWPTSVAQMLNEYVNEGGSLVAFAAPALQQNMAILLEQQANRHWQPGPYSVEDTSRALQRSHELALLLPDFGPEQQSIWQSIPLLGRQRTGKLRSTSRVLMRYQDATPALVMEQVGRGRLVIANFNPDKRAGELAKHGVFVALTQSLARSLAMPRQQDAVAAGEPMMVIAARPPVARGEPVVVRGPGNQQIYDAHRQGDGAIWRVPQTHEPGHYALWQGADKLGMTAVNVPESEGDLRTLDIAELEKKVASTPGNAVRSGSAGEMTQRADHQPLWGYLLLLAAMAFAMEMLLLSYWRR